MSRDIRSFFKALPSNNISASKKRSIDSDEDVVDTTPEQPTKKAPKRRRKLIVLSSDSEEGSPSKKGKRKQKVQESTNLKSVNALDVFGASPILQAKVEKLKTPENVASISEIKPKKKKNKKTELGIHGDDAFEKSLLELDEDDLLFDNIDVLDKTIDEALNGDIENQKNDIKDTRKRPQPPTKETPKRVKLDDSLNTSGMDPDEERFEKRRQSAQLYKQYLHRPPPAHHGCKEYPTGKPDCLRNACFLRTGVLDSLEGEEFDSLVKKHGGRTVNSVSRKVNYLVVGDEPGPAKLEKARNYGIKTISEDDLLDLILVKSGMEAKYVKATEEPEGSATKALNKNHKQETKATTSTSSKSKKKNKDDDEIPSITRKNVDTPKKHKAGGENEIPRVTVKKSDNEKSHKNKSASFPEVKTEKIIKPKLTHSKDLEPIKRESVKLCTENMSWTERYKPSVITQVIGQAGPSSNLRKLLVWLSNWHVKQAAKGSKSWNNTAYFKCALLSGPPGVGKTTTAVLVAKELGFDAVEFNASDTRSKRLLTEEVSQLLSTKSLAGFVTNGAAPTRKHVLLMDEVDGMAGNEDRGGMQELIALIKKTNVPIICMCNDRQHQKMRSLLSYCFELRFARPRLEQIREAMQTICKKEGVDITQAALDQVIAGSGMDIRQTLNHLSIWTATDKSLSEDDAQGQATKARKDTILGPWEVCRKVFSQSDHKSMSLVDKAKLFYYDYSIGPLFVQENYLNVTPQCAKKEVMKRVSSAADCISMGDLIDRQIRGSNNWALLEAQSMYSSVLPGHYMAGNFSHQINFPSWLGKNSKKTKFKRLLGEVQSHMRLSASASKEAVNLDYVYHIRDRIINPLIKKGTAGVAEALEVMNTYNLLREDLDSIVELSQWSHQKNLMTMIDSKVKAAFTRAYNKDSAKLPYSINTAAIKKKTSNVDEAAYNEDEGDGNSNPEDDDDDVSKDAMILAKKKPTAKAKKTTAVAGTSKKQAGGGGKAKKNVK